MKYKLFSFLETKKDLLCYTDKDRFPFSKFITNLEEIKQYLNSFSNNENVYKALYLNRVNFDKISFDYDELININSFEITSLSELFYLSLILKENPYYLVYSYNMDYVKSLNRLNEISLNMNVRRLLISKIISEGIYNFKGLDNYDENNNEQILNDIEKRNSEIIVNNLEIFKNINLEYTFEEIRNKKIDEFYTDIIKGLIKSKKINDYNFAFSFINQMDLEHIDITENMLNGLKEILDENKNYDIRDLKISKIDDFNNEKKINFYFLILKYIFKNPFDIYQIPFLLNTKLFILNLIKKKEYFNLNINNNKDKIYFILKSLLDSEYYFEKFKDYISNISDNNKIEQKSNPFKVDLFYFYEQKKYEGDKKLLEINLNDSILSENTSIKAQKTIKNMEKDINKKADITKILEYIKIIETEINFNGKIIEGYNGQYISTRDRNNYIIYDCYFNQLLEVYNDESNISLQLELLQNNLSLTSEKDVTLPLIYEYKKKKLENDFNINSNKTDDNNIKYKDKFQLNENICIFKSYNFFQNSEDKLIFYDMTEKKELRKIEGYSFTDSPHGILKMKLKGLNKLDNENVLLCACKKYNNSQKNGIVLINPNIEENKEIIILFYDTHNFEVNCFCQILNVENKNNNFENINEEYRKNINIEITDYFFVGGFDADKNEGKIKLFHLKYKDDINKIKIKFVQDIEFENKEEFDGFDEAINSIIQSTIRGNILVSSYDGKIYLFSAPNIDFYLNKN